MVRSHRDEIEHRYQLRKKYLEEPSYRRWSDIAPDKRDINSVYINPFSELRDDVMFCYLITNKSSGRPTTSQLVERLNKGHELPINWVNFYAYFDKQLNDPENRYLSYLKDCEIMGDAFEPKTSVEELLNRYRDRLLSTYDMI